MLKLNKSRSRDFILLKVTSLGLLLRSSFQTAVPNTYHVTLCPIQDAFTA